MDVKTVKTVGTAVEMTLQEVAADGRKHLENAYYAVLATDLPEEKRDEIVVLMGQADTALDVIENTAALTTGLVDQLTTDLRGAAEKAKLLAERLKSKDAKTQHLESELASAYAEIRRLRDEMNTAVDAAFQTGINKGFDNAQIAYRS
jgi:hypothetical protein